MAGNDNIPTEIIKSVVKLYVTHCGPWYSRPWEMDVCESSTSSGFVISTESGEIMCSAHGVVDSTSIRVRKYGESKKYNAKIKYIGHDCDLAILQIDDKKFWSNKRKDTQPLKPIEFINITPSLQDTITVLGYPKGGDDLSVTQGVVSRVGFTNYSHSLKYLLTIQIDAAINDGNSGGPCLDTNGKVVGVAFQGITDADNIGYCVPVRVITHFLECKGKNKPYIVPCLPIIYSSIENESMKHYLKMVTIEMTNDENKDKDLEESDDDEDEMEGILLNKIYPFTDCAKKLEKQDVILSIDGVCIGDDGTIKYGKNSRIDLNYIVTNKFDGDCVELSILRDGAIFSISVILHKHSPLCAVHLFSSSPDYFIFGGLVFLALSRPFLQHKFGIDSWRKKTPSTLKYVYFNRLKELRADEQCIVLSQVLASHITVGYHNYKNYILHTINNDIKLINIKHLAQTVDDLCLVNKSKNKFIKFKFESQHIIVLNINQALNSANHILKRHKIEHDRSQNLRAIQKEQHEQKHNTNDKIDKNDKKDNIKQIQLID